MKYSILLLALIGAISLTACERHPQTVVVAVPGPTAIPGPTGAPGPQGEKGDTGDKGDKGDAGESSGISSAAATDTTEPNHP